MAAELPPDADRRFGRGYLVALPVGYHADVARQWPLVLFLHGRGEWGEDLALVRSQGIGALVDAARMPEAIVVAPQTPEGQYWHPLFVDAVLRKVEDAFRIDPTRRYLTGLSMGGFGTLATALAFPNRFAAIAPICGGMPNDFVAAERGVAFCDEDILQPVVSRIRHLPVFIAHGEDDPLVPVEMSRRVVRLLEASGNTPEQRWLDGVGHDAWTPIYFDEPAFFPWLMRHQRSVNFSEPECHAVDTRLAGTYTMVGARAEVSVVDGDVLLNWSNGRCDTLLPLDDGWFIGPGLVRIHCGPTNGMLLDIPGVGRFRRG